MSIVATEVESIHGGSADRRIIFYRCQDHLGVWHSGWRVTTTDPNFDLDAYKAVVAAKAAESLAAKEADKEFG